SCIVMKILHHISPIAWQHINFYGRYEFSKSPTVVNIEEILESINKDAILTSLTREDPLEK
ncbi:Tn3 family transposase, partial [Bacillus cereus]|nr:Tn3 family transposase [Bacillus cereus]